MEERDEAKLFRACRVAIVGRQQIKGAHDSIARLLWVENARLIARWESGERSIPGPV
jgi:hypothetical protein